MEKRAGVALEKFSKGYNCAQSVIYAFADDFGFDGNLALKIASGLGAGMGRAQEVCGAVTGGILVVGMRYGRGENDDAGLREASYAKTRELMDRFSGEHGTYMCRGLLEGCDLASEEGQRRFKEKDLKTTVCSQCVLSVVHILEDILGKP